MIKQIAVQQATFAAAKRSFTFGKWPLLYIFQNFENQQQFQFFFLIGSILGDNSSSLSVLYSHEKFLFYIYITMSVEAVYTGWYDVGTRSPEVHNLF